MTKTCKPPHLIVVRSAVSDKMHCHFLVQDAAIVPCEALADSRNLCLSLSLENEQTQDTAAQLAALLLVQYHLPLSRLLPHRRHPAFLPTSHRWMHFLLKTAGYYSVLPQPQKEVA